MFRFVFLSVFIPAMCLPASCSKDIPQRQPNIPMLQQMCSTSVKKMLLYDRSRETVAHDFEYMRTHRSYATMPIILSALNEALINIIGWHKAKELPSDFSPILTEVRDADNLYDDAGNRILWKTTTFIHADGRRILNIMNRDSTVDFHRCYTLKLQVMDTFAYSSDRNYMLLAIGDTIHLFKNRYLLQPDGSDDSLIKTFYLSRKPSGNSYMIKHIELSNDNQTIICRDEINNEIIYLNVKTGSVIRTIYNVTAAKSSPDGKLLACTSKTGSLEVFDNETGTRIYGQSFACSDYHHSDSLLKWSPDGTFLVGVAQVGGYYRRILCWNRYTNQCLAGFRTDWFIKQTAITEDGDILIQKQARWSNPWRIYRSYLHELRALAELDDAKDKPLIPFLLTALEQSWRYQRPHAVSKEDYDRHAVISRLLPFAATEKLFTFNFASK